MYQIQYPSRPITWWGIQCTQGIQTLGDMHTGRKKENEKKSLTLTGSNVLRERWL
jgi:hypothetical protein